MTERDAAQHWQGIVLNPVAASVLLQGSFRSARTGIPSTPEAVEPAELFAFDVRADRGAVWLTLQGEIDLSVSSLLGSAFDQAISQATTSLVADLGDVQYIDSSGLKVLVDARQTCDAAGLPFQIVNPTPLVKTVFDVAGLLDALCPGEVVDARADA